MSWPDETARAIIFGGPKGFKSVGAWLRSCFFNSLPSFLFRPPFYGKWDNWDSYTGIYW
jgi:hypothetical protein